MKWRGKVKVSGGEALVKSLVEHEVKTVYGLPGSHILDIYNSLRDEVRIHHILAMHEVNAAFMADAHGRLTGKPGVCIVTAGPGATNALTGIAQAYTEASPVVQITGHPSTHKKIQPDHGVDDWEFLLKIYRPLTKWSTRIEKVKDITPILDKAFTLATSGRPGPVHLEIPQDVLATSGEISGFKANLKAESPGITSSVERVAEVLKSATHPMIVAGRGVLREFCSDEVIKLARSLGAPILTLPSAISAIPFQCPLYLGYDLSGYGARWMVHPLINSVIKKSDTILTLGLDVGERLALSKDKSDRLIHIHHDISAAYSDEIMAGKPKPLIAVEASVRDFVTLLEKRIKMKNTHTKTVEKHISSIKNKIRKDIAKSISWGSKPIHPGEIATELRHMLDEDAIVTLDIGNSSQWMKVCYRARRSNTILIPGRYGSMGFSLPAAIAAKINFPTKQVVAVTGDGGFLMSYMDFPTLVRHKLDVMVVVENNRRYGMIWHMQRAKYRGRTFATEIPISDLVEYARAFGATGIKVSDSKDLKTALEEATNVRGPVLVDIDTEHKFPSYIPTRIVRFLRKMKYFGMPPRD